MNKWLKYLRKLNLTYDVVISLLGVLLIVFLILTFLNPENRYIMLAAFAFGGFINIANGMKILGNKKRRNLGISYIFFGIIIIFIGYMTSTL